MLQKVLIEGDIGGGERAFRVRLDGSDEILLSADYDLCGWSFHTLIPQVTALAEALGAEVEDVTT